MVEQDAGGSVTPPTRTGAGARAGDPIAAAQSLSRYQILGVAGSGGMGRVYAAFDPKLDRRVALKVVHGSSPAHQLRAAREAKALARLSHPNAVAIHEVEEHEGQLLIAMEYVRGRTLKAWMTEHPPSQDVAWLIDALDVLLQAGRGLAAAHDAALVHRDFKPSNVLVGDDGRVRVVDFGLARDVVDEPNLTATDDDDDHVTGSSERVTRTGVVMGTPGYMAPEQSVAGPQDARMDQYSFCVTAWEVLFAERPEGSKVKRPVASSVPEGVEKALRRGLKTAAAGRFESMAQLLERIERERDALLGKTPRSRWLRGGVVLGAVGLVTGAVVGGRALIEEAELDSCEDASAAIDEVWNEDASARFVEDLSVNPVGTDARFVEGVTIRLDDYAEAWSEAHREACRIAVVAEAWTPQEHDAVRTCLEDRRLELTELVDQVGRRDVTAVPFAFEAAAGLPSIQPCLDPEALDMGSSAERDRVEFRKARDGVRQARIQFSLGQYEQAEATARDALAAAEEAGSLSLLAEARLQLAYALEENGDFENAEDAARFAYQTALRSRAWTVAEEAARAVASALSQQGQVEASYWLEIAAALHGAPGVGELAEAELAYTEALVARRTAHFAEWLEPARRAATLFEEKVGKEHPRTEAALEVYATALLENGKHEQALELASERLQSAKTNFGSDHPFVADALGLVASIEDRTGLVDEALKNAEASLEIYRRVVGPRHLKTAMAYRKLGQIHMSAGNWDRSWELLETSVRIMEDDAEKTESSGWLTLLAQAADRAGKPERAAEVWARALQGIESSNPAPTDSIMLYVNVGRFKSRHEKFDEALTHFDEALRIAQTELGARHPEVAYVLNNIGLLLMRAGRFAEALEPMQQAIDIHTETVSTSDIPTSFLYENLGKIHRGLGRFEEALEAWEHGQRLRLAMLAPDSKLAKKLPQLIGELCTQEGYRPACESAMAP